MGSFLNSKAKKKKGKKQKGQNKSEWERDGTSVLTAKDGPLLRGPRRTAAKEDAVRRRDLRNAQASFAKKQNQKKYNIPTFASASRSIIVEEHGTGQNLMQQEKQAPRLSKLTAWDRLLHIGQTSPASISEAVPVSGSSNSDHESEDDDESTTGTSNSGGASGDVDDDVGDIDGDGGIEDENDDDNGDDNDYNISGNAKRRKSEEQKMEDDGDDIELTIEKSANYVWFFSSEDDSHNEDEGKGNFATIDEDGDMTLIGRMSSKVAIPSPRISRLDNITDLHKSLKWRQHELCDPTSSFLLPYMRSYTDFMIEGRNHLNDQNYLEATSIHIGLHLLKTLSLVQKHDGKLRKEKKQMAEAKKLENLLELESGGHKKVKKRAQATADTQDSVSDAASLRDQGYTRPRVLFLCPFRSTALRFVETLVTFLGENTSVTNLDKFVDEFGADDNQSAEPREMPEDWKELFENKNVDDNFKMGIQFNVDKGKGKGTNKGSHLRLYTDFYQSDIIIASPIGLKVLEDEKKQSYDYLSSIEILVVHQADVILMQNMEHLLHVIDQSNLPPGKNHDTDFGRVRPYFLENRACEHRQLILTTAWAHPLISSLFRRGKSLAGALRVHVSTDFGYDSDMHGCMLDLVLPKCNQIFQKIPCTDPKDQYDLKYDYFKGDILSQIQRLEQKYTLIVAPSYLDYVRIRNLLIETEANAAFICEYSRDSEISRSRSRFFHGIKDILLYSGRCHFFRRYLIRGARHIIFYSLPEYAHFYPELVNPLGEHEASEPISCTVLFTRYELAALQRLVGPQRAKQMLASAKNTFLFNSS